MSSISRELSSTVRNETDRRFFGSRLQSSLKAILKTKRPATSGLMVSTVTTVQISALALSYFCLEGAVRSIIDTVEDTRPIIKIRPLGDVGGWISLALFSTLVMKDSLERLIGEGEYLELKPICQKWIQENQALLEKDPRAYDELYTRIHQLLAAYSSRCFFPKSALSRRLFALEIQKESQLAERASQLSDDRKLETIFLSIRSHLNKSSYLQRVSLGHQRAMKRGCLNHSASLIFGIAFPIILLLNSIFSMIGEVGLGKELFIDQEELTDVGHFGEWPINAVEALASAFFIHLWYILNEGDFEITRKIYARELEGLQDEPTLHNHLCDLAHEELAQIGASCNSMRLPLDYQFEKR